MPLLRLAVRCANGSKNLSKAMVHLQRSEISLLISIMVRQMAKRRRITNLTRKLLNQNRKIIKE